MRVGVLGAGAIGAYVGVCLSGAGLEVVLVDRQPLDAGALRAVDLAGRTHTAGLGLTAETDPRALADVDLCLVAVKSGATTAAAKSLAGVLPADCPVVSLQNGLHNPERLRHHVAGPVIPAVVGWNVTLEGDGTLRQTVAGPLLLGRGDDPSAVRRVAAFAERVPSAIARVSICDDIEARMRGKLLLNLNNGVCGATGLGIAQMLADRDARWCFAQCLQEGDRVLRAAGIPPARVGVLGPRALALVLHMPTPLLRAAMRGPLAIDATATASTLQDLRRGRVTEIDELNGEIVRIADARDLQAPCNRIVVDAVRAHEQRGARGESPRWVSAGELRRRMHASLATAVVPSSVA